MRSPDSPSKNLRRTQSRGKLRTVFCQGVGIGLCLVFLWTAFALLRRNETSETHSTTPSTQTPPQRTPLPKLVAFVGVQSGFSKPGASEQYRYELRREILRRTWFPPTRRHLDMLESKKGIRVRFVIGHSNDSTAEFNLETEQKRNRDIVRLPILEDYLGLPYKILTFLRYVSTHFDAQYIVKIDDDVFFRLDRLPHAIPQWQQKEADYIGCMKRGEVFKRPNFRWREPQFPILGDAYYTHVWGCAYVISGRVAAFLTAIPEGSLRFLNNEDTTIGSWMLAFNVTYLDDRRFCATNCTESSLVVYDYPHTAGLKEPHKDLLRLAKSPKCQESPDAIALEREIIPVNTVRSRKLPEQREFEGVAI